ncbi:MAG: NAD(P)H-hydrate dehydratase [Bacteroidales bacterium]|nr:NAD(P)H-hydrate dehydratase [Bacteroidales bacterium]
MKIFETKKIEELDAYTIKHEPIQSIDLMERAAMGIVNALKRFYSHSNRFVIFAGPGNNGGDALAVARLLFNEGYEIYTYLFNPQDKLSKDCAENREKLTKLKGIFFSEVINSFVPPQFKPEDVIIDGLFGAGLTRPLSGGFAHVVNYINQCAQEVISIDVPSGLFGENNLTNNSEYIIQAKRTFTFQFPKLAFLFSENAKYVGDITIIDIHLHPDILEKSKSNIFFTERKDIVPLLKKRERFSHKGSYGHALLIAGQKGKIGAALLAGKSTLRSGAGLLTMHLPASAYTIVQTALPEAMNSYDTEENMLTTLPDLSPFSAVAIGPGTGTSEQSFYVLEMLLQNIKVPLIIDADGLNLLALHPHLQEIIPENTILTPHPKEFDRLFGEHKCAYERHLRALSIAQTKKIYIILKGAYSAIYTPDGECYFNSSGNPGMATAGSGDALTGILLGFLSQGYTPKDTALLGVYLHGLAGDIAKRQYSEEAMITSDIIESMGEAFSLLRNFV